MGCNHIRKQEEAQAAADEEMSMKIRQRDLQERLKRTCEVFIWLKVCLEHKAGYTAADLIIQNGTEPLQLKYYIATYPTLLLSDLSDLLAQCSYHEGSFLQYYA